MTCLQWTVGAGKGHRIPTPACGTRFLRVVMRHCRRDSKHGRDQYLEHSFEYPAPHNNLMVLHATKSYIPPTLIPSITITENYGEVHTKVEKRTNIAIFKRLLLQ